MLDSLSDLKIITTPIRASTTRLRARWSAKIRIENHWMKTPLNMLEYLVWIDSGLIPLQLAKYHMDPVLEALPPAEARYFRRRFRKAWRKLARVRPRDFAQRMRTDNDPNDPWAMRRHRRRDRVDVCVGCKPKKSISYDRKVLVMRAVRERANELHDSFQLSLGARPATSGVP